MALESLRKYFLGERKRQPELKVSSLADEEARKRTVEAMGEGKVIPFDLVSVWGFLANAANPLALAKIEEIKKEKGPKIYSALMLADAVDQIIKREAVHKDLLHLIENADTLKKRVGLLTFLRIPVRDEAIQHIPHSLLSEQNGQTIMHVLMPDEHPYMRQLLLDLSQAGIRNVAVTSANIFQQPERIHQEDVMSMLRGVDGVGEVLTDPLRRGYAKGSYSIFGTIDKRLYRRGFVDDGALELALDIKGLDTNGAKDRHVEYLPLPVSLDGKTPQEVHDELITLMFDRNNG